MASFRIEGNLDDNEVFGEIKTTLMRQGINVRAGGLIIKDKGGATSVAQSISLLGNNTGRLLELFIKHYRMPRALSIPVDLLTSLRVPHKDVGKIETAVRALCGQYGFEIPDVASLAGEAGYTAEI